MPCITKVFLQTEKGLKITNAGQCTVSLVEICGPSSWKMKKGNQKEWRNCVRTRTSYMQSCCGQKQYPAYTLIQSLLHCQSHIYICTYLLLFLLQRLLSHISVNSEQVHNQIVNVLFYTNHYTKKKKTQTCYQHLFYRIHCGLQR